MSGFKSQVIKTYTQMLRAAYQIERSPIAVPEFMKRTKSASASNNSALKNDSLIDYVKEQFRLPRKNEKDAVQALQSAQELLSLSRALQHHQGLLDGYNLGTHIDPRKRLQVNAKRVGLELPKFST